MQQMLSLPQPPVPHPLACGSESKRALAETGSGGSVYHLYLTPSMKVRGFGHSAVYRGAREVEAWVFLLEPLQQNAALLFLGSYGI